MVQKARGTFIKAQKADDNSPLESALEAFTFFALCSILYLLGFF